MTDWPQFLEGKLTAAEDHSTQINIGIAGGIYVRQVHIPQADTVLVQHVHPIAHLTCVARGEVLLVRGDVMDRKRYAAPALIKIDAGVAHSVISLVPDTLLLCIHNLLDPASASVLAEHGIGLEDVT